MVTIVVIHLLCNNELLCISHGLVNSMYSKQLTIHWLISEDYISGVVLWHVLLTVVNDIIVERTLVIMQWKW